MSIYKELKEKKTEIYKKELAEGQKTGKIQKKQMQER